MDMGYYILGGADGHTPVHVDDVLTWARWFEESREKRVVKQDRVGEYFVSTVFLGLAHNYARACHPERDLPPHIFETMVFYGEDRGGVNQERCSTWAEAEAQHERLASALRVAVAG
jgi:hypothetical protein